MVVTFLREKTNTLSSVKRHSAATPWSESGSVRWKRRCLMLSGVSAEGGEAALCARVTFIRWSPLHVRLNRACSGLRLASLEPLVPSLRGEEPAKTLDEGASLSHITFILHISMRSLCVDHRHLSRASSNHGDVRRLSSTEPRCCLGFPAATYDVLKVVRAQGTTVPRGGMLDHGCVCV